MLETTSDFYLSAFFCLNGLELKEMRSQENRKLFVFEDTDELQQLKRDYYWNNATVDPLSYKKAIRQLKGMVMNH